MAHISHVIVVGAGPAGLLLALLLKRAGISKVTILEREAQPIQETRAVFYQPIAFREFRRAGVMDAVEAAGYNPDRVSFRTMAGEELFAMPGKITIALTMNKLAAIVQEEVEKCEGAEILYGHEVLSLGEDDDKGKAWLSVKTAGGEKKLEADYVVGCDGGGSTVRRCLFGENSMPGFTWDKKLIALNITYDFPEFPDIADSNFFMDAEKSWVLFRPGKEGNFWRVIYSEDPAMSDEEAMGRYGEALKARLPGHPEAHEYEVRQIRPYKIHQRIVDKMRKGRFLLASDAAHLCCPYGALGLNGGIADVGSLSDCLQAINDGDADDSILDVYSDVRRQKWKTVVDKQSQGTLKLLFSNPSDVIPDHRIYKFAQMLETDPEAALKTAPDPLALKYDFSSHFRNEASQITT